MPINAFSKSQTIKSKREKDERLQTTFEYPGEKLEVCAPSVAVVIPDNIARQQQNCPKLSTGTSRDVNCPEMLGKLER